MVGRQDSDEIDLPDFGQPSFKNGYYKNNPIIDVNKKLTPFQGSRKASSFVKNELRPTDSGQWKQPAQHRSAYSVSRPCVTEPIEVTSISSRADRYQSKASQENTGENKYGYLSVQESVVDSICEVTEREAVFEEGEELYQHDEYVQELPNLENDQDFYYNHIEEDINYSIEQRGDQKNVDSISYDMPPITHHGRDELNNSTYRSKTNMNRHKSKSVRQIKNRKSHLDSYNKSDETCKNYSQAIMTHRGEYYEDYSIQSAPRYDKSYYLYDKTTTKQSRSLLTCNKDFQKTYPNIYTGLCKGLLDITQLMSHELVIPVKEDITFQKEMLRSKRAIIANVSDNLGRLIMGKFPDPELGTKIIRKIAIHFYQRIEIGIKQAEDERSVVQWLLRTDVENHIDLTLSTSLNCGGNTAYAQIEGNAYLTRKKGELLSVINRDSVQIDMDLIIKLIFLNRGQLRAIDKDAFFVDRVQTSANYLAKEVVCTMRALQ